MDPTFKTSDGTEWRLRLTPFLIGKVRSELKIDLADVQGVAKAVDDPFLLGCVLWTLCEKQAKERNLDEERFSEGFDGDVIGEAVGALFQAHVNFTPPSRRKVSDKLIRKTLELRELQAHKATVALDADPETLLDLILKGSGSSPTSSPAPSASPPESPST